MIRLVPPRRIDGVGTAIHIAFSERRDGDFHRDPHGTGVVPADLEARRRALVDLPWSQPDEVHGTVVSVVGHPGEHDGASADALVSRLDDAVLGIWVGDCAPVAFWGDDGSIATAHAGWRGALAGVLQATVDTLRAGGADRVDAVLGPCIHPCCYEFSDADLALGESRHGPSVRSTTAHGRPALDMRALVSAALAEVDVVVDDRSLCTGCHGDRWFSHRARGERERQVLAVWRE